jgi:hypothetical protein
MQKAKGWRLVVDYIAFNSVLLFTTCHMHILLGWGIFLMGFELFFNVFCVEDKHARYFFLNHLLGQTMSM